MLSVLSSHSELAAITPQPTRPLRLIELYRSVQGESSFAGVPCIFVRLAGCNLRCSWCDSEYTFTGGQPFTNDEILKQIEALQPCRLIEFTGGEPMLQARELLPLMGRLLEAGYDLMIETSGERPLADVPKAVHKIVDVKCPGSGMAHTFRTENLQALTSNERSAENMALDPRLLVDWMLADSLPARLSLQIHKFIWEPRKKGV